MAHIFTQKIYVLVSILALLVLSNCGGRAAKPVQVSQPQDETLSCAYLKEYIIGINKQIASHVKEKDHRDNNNVGLVLMYGVSGALMTDATDTEETEIRALIDRNRRLARLMESRDCDDIPTVITSVDGNPDVAENIKKALESDQEPACADVGGWEHFHEKTGKSCRL